MPGEPGYGLTAASIRYLMRQLRKVEGLARPRTGKPDVPHTQVPQAWNMWVKVTGGLDTGRYPGICQTYDPTTHTFSDEVEVVWVRASDSSALVSGTVYWGRLEDQATGTAAPAERAVYLVAPGGAGGGAPPAGEVCVIDGGNAAGTGCDPVTGAGGSYDQPVIITLPSGSTGASFTVNVPGTSTPA